MHDSDRPLLQGVEKWISEGIEYDTRKSSTKKSRKTTTKVKLGLMTTFKKIIYRERIWSPQRSGLCDFGEGSKYSEDRKKVLWFKQHILFKRKVCEAPFGIDRWLTFLILQLQEHAESLLLFWVVF